jgi:hypothetical protein
MVSRNDKKNQMINAYKNLQLLYEFEFIEESKLLSLLSQVAEVTVDCDYNRDLCPDQIMYKHHSLGQKLREEREHAIRQLILHCGSLL